MWSLQNHSPNWPDPPRRAALSGDWMAVIEDGEATPFAMSSHDVELFGPTSYVVGDASHQGERVAMRLDAPMRMYSETFPQVPDSGTLALTFGWRGDDAEPQALHIDGPFELGIFPTGDFGDDEIMIRWNVHDSSSIITLPTLSNGWHTLLTTWDRAAGTRHLYFDGEPIDMNDGAFAAPYPNDLLIVGPWFENDPDGYKRDGLPSIALLEMHDLAWATEDAAGHHAWEMEFLSPSEPLAEGADILAGALSWDDPFVEVTGWVLRIAPANGDPVLEIKLPADARRYEPTDIPGGIAHLYAVNEQGWSTPAEVVF